MTLVFYVVHFCHFHFFAGQIAVFCHLAVAICQHWINDVVYLTGFADEQLLQEESNIEQTEERDSPSSPILKNSSQDREHLYDLSPTDTIPIRPSNRTKQRRTEEGQDRFYLHYLMQFCFNNYA
jgi:hypothetical protein